MPVTSNVKFTDISLKTGNRTLGTLSFDAHPQEMEKIKVIIQPKKVFILN